MPDIKKEMNNFFSFCVWIVLLEAVIYFKEKLVRFQILRCFFYEHSTEKIVREKHHGFKPTISCLRVVFSSKILPSYRVPGFEPVRLLFYLWFLIAWHQNGSSSGIPIKLLSAGSNAICILTLSNLTLFPKSISLATPHQSTKLGLDFSPH